MADTPSGLIRTWLARQSPEPASAWLHEQIEKLSAAPAERDIHIALGMIPRRLGREDLELKAEDLAKAGQVLPDWDPSGWSLDEAARILVLCTLDRSNRDFATFYADLCRTADVQESIALYKGLPLYPNPEALVAQAAEGVRTNMRAIFEAVAHRNPFPRDHFDENRWNQMVLKALFIGSKLDPILGLDQRANPALAAMLIDYAHERWAAGRTVTPELWRCVGPFAMGQALGDLKRALSSDDGQEQQGAALALSASPVSEAKTLLAATPALTGRIESGELTWHSLAMEL